MLETHFEQIWSIWRAGGWVMIPLLALSLVIYWNAMRLLLYFRRRAFHRLTEDTWREWVKRPDQGEGEVGELIRFTQDGARTMDDVHVRFAEVAASKLPVIDRRLNFLNVLITAAPLLGLLGTVFGMLVTFQALALGGGGRVTDQMAAGISQALFPPEVGLCIALPALMLAYVIKRKRQEYEAFLAQVESFTVQEFKRRISPAPAPAASTTIARPAMAVSAGA